MCVAQCCLILATGLKRVLGIFIYFDVRTVHLVRFIIQTNERTTCTWGAKKTYTHFKRGKKQY